MATKERVLRIGIASREEIQARTIAIARGEFRPGPNDPKVWFTSLESLAQVLSTRNQLLLELIAQSKPTSLKELAHVSGRQPSNLSRTLSTFERYGFVNVRTSKGRRVPEVLYDRIELNLEIARDVARRAQPRRDPAPVS